MSVDPPKDTAWIGADSGISTESVTIDPETVFPLLNTGLEGMHKDSAISAAQWMSTAALQSQEGLDTWNKSFKGICPGCFTPHHRRNPFIRKGICIPCRFKMGRALKSLGLTV